MQTFAKVQMPEIACSCITRDSNSMAYLLLHYYSTWRLPMRRFYFHILRSIAMRMRYILIVCTWRLEYGAWWTPCEIVHWCYVESLHRFVRGKHRNDEKLHRIARRQMVTSDGLHMFDRMLYKISIDVLTGTQHSVPILFAVHHSTNGLWIHLVASGTLISLSNCAPVDVPVGRRCMFLMLSVEIAVATSSASRFAYENWNNEAETTIQARPCPFHMPWNSNNNRNHNKKINF